jgi:hypothetical protein
LATNSLERRNKVWRDTSIVALHLRRGIGPVTDQSNLERFASGSSLERKSAVVLEKSDTFDGSFIGELLRSRSVDGRPAELTVGLDGGWIEVAKFGEEGVATGVGAVEG